MGMHCFFFASLHFLRCMTWFYFSPRSSCQMSAESTDETLFSCFFASASRLVQFSFFFSIFASYRIFWWLHKLHDYALIPAAASSARKFHILHTDLTQHLTPCRPKNRLSALTFPFLLHAPLLFNAVPVLDASLFFHAFWLNTFDRSTKIRLPSPPPSLRFDPPS